MSELHRTVLFDRHKSLGGKIVEFAGWEMPLQYEKGIVQEHLATRLKAGLFDVSHMGRFIIRGSDALAFLQHTLTNNAASLDVEESQYTMIPNEQGGAVDDAYLFRFVEDEYLLVVNASNREKDWNHFQSYVKDFKDIDMVDRTFELAMLSLQGPLSKRILTEAMTEGYLPEPMRNYLSIGEVNGAKVMISRTGYTGEPLGFELFIERDDAPMIWDLLLGTGGAEPVGLGARDTLRMEGGLPLYGHEMGQDPEGKEIPIYSSPLARFAVSLSPLKEEFVGKESLQRQFEAFKRIVDRDYALMADLPRLTMPIALEGRGVARAGDEVFASDKQVGYVTSGTMVPYWQSEGVGLESRLIDEKTMRAICLAFLDSDICEGEEVEVAIRGKKIKAAVVPYHLRTEAPPIARAIPYDRLRSEAPVCPAPQVDDKTLDLVTTFVKKAAENTLWRQQQCINLIPSEQTPSVMSRLLSIMDPSCRYAEHKQMKAFSEAEVFYYQGTDFIAEVEENLNCEFQRFLGCTQVESRVVSGQMANTAVFSAMVDFLNRADRKNEQRRIRQILNHHIIKGGHLSAQPMGALRDFVMRDPKTEGPAVVNFPVLEENPFQVDLEKCREILEEYRPELVIFGKSMILHKEPVSEVRSMVEELSLECVLMYDMAHVLGLAGPHYQDPFGEGADLVTGSTHKTFFGTQRGVIASNYEEEDLRFELWEAIQRRTFPGSVSNHHLGTMVGLLLAAYEMNYFKDSYQRQVVANAKAFARALKTSGLDVAGDPAISYTETHQVVVNVGYAKGPEIARRLEENNIVLNYQAAPDEEGFTAAGALRTGVSEMTRFGMKEADFEEVAQFMRDVIMDNLDVKEKVSAFRQRFFDMKYCFSGEQFEEHIQKLHKLI